MILVLPIILPLFFMVVLIFTRRWLAFQQHFSLLASVILILVSVILLIDVEQNGIATLQVGSWIAPYGITLVVDLLSAIMLITVSFIAIVIMIYSPGFIDKGRQSAGYYPISFGLLMGVNGAFITGDIFNLYVWYEVMLTSSFVLIALGGSAEQLRGSIKYVTINFIASVFFVAAIGILYGLTGTLNMADLAFKLRTMGDIPYLDGALMLFFIAFSVKSALFPFFFWLPASYHTPPIPITALFAGTLTKVGIYTMFRFYSLFIVDNTLFWKTFILVIAGLTMTIGVLMAASQFDIRKILSFHIISQVGYMVMGLGLFTVGGIAGAIYFMVHNMLSKTNTFLAGGLVYQRSGSYDLKHLGGLYKASPLLALLFFIPAMSLAGIPPLPGFFGKFFLIKGGFEAGDYFITGVAILVGLFTLFSMVKIWNEAYWKKEPEEVKKGKVSRRAIAATTMMAIAVVLLGLFAGPVSEITVEAARQVVFPDLYINAVLGK
ncbi:MAG: proton-conducting transporter membrane subunit [Bacteroides sp.]|jgi:multicomponent Na+:H+ antiporter subunit D|nr:proton-conducting transporter membrane subunit [Bacteroides sp.]